METNGNFHKSQPRNHIEINVFLAVIRKSSFRINCCFSHAFFLLPFFKGTEPLLLDADLEYL